MPQNVNSLKHNTRNFEIKVNESINLFEFINSNKPRNKNYYYDQQGSAYKFNGNVMNQQAVYKVMHLIEAEVKKTAINLKYYWRKQIPQYFNRRSHGLYTSPIELFNSIGHRMDKKLWQQYKNQPYTTQRGSSHQLENALEITKISVDGAQFYVVPCMSHDGRDYVEFLIEGRPEGGPPYHPSEDKRFYSRADRQYGNEWGGISDLYWAAWQAQFIRVLNQNENLMNEHIHKILVQNNFISPNTKVPYTPVMVSPDHYVYTPSKAGDYKLTSPVPWENLGKNFNRVR